MKYYLTIIITLLLFSTAESQITQIKKSYVKGRIINDSTGKRIAFAHIYNESRRQGFIGNENGEFQIPAKAGDSIVFSALGYFARVVILSKTDHKNGITIKLQQRYYEIEEVSVRLFKDYEDFKRQFLALEVPKTRTDRLRDNLKIQSHKVAKKAEYERQVKETLEKPYVQLFSVSIPIYSREEKQLRNYAEVLKKEERQRIIDKKYNRKIIYEITHLSDDEITEFMGFCNFSEAFLFEASEYEILVKIEEKFKDYKLWKESDSLYFEDVRIPKELASSNRFNTDHKTFIWQESLMIR